VKVKLRWLSYKPVRENMGTVMQSFGILSIFLDSRSQPHVDILQFDVYLLGIYSLTKSNSFLLHQEYSYKN